MSGRLEPLSTDLVASRRFAVRALEVRAAGAREPSGWASEFEQRLFDGTVEGRLYVVDGQPSGLAGWSPGGPLGIQVGLVYDAGEGSDPATYRHLLEAVETEAGPIVLLSGPLAGLAPATEDTLMRGLGFRRFGRSEMVFEPNGGSLDVRLDVGEAVRPAARTDLGPLADLHRAAYHERFDRYLFLEDPDEVEDARRAVTEILDGRWGEFEPAGSWILDRDGHAVGAVLSVRSPAGTLIADVAVAPEHQGVGVGRKLLAHTVRSLCRTGGGKVFLNVTEGNERALRLYRRLGFVRSLGPTRDWYNARRIPVAPSPDA